jgi:hypothetical protein
MGRTRSMHRGNENFTTKLFGKRIILYNIKTYLQRRSDGSGLDSSGSGYGPVGGFL